MARLFILQRKDKFAINYNNTNGNWCQLMIWNSLIYLRYLPITYTEDIITCRHHRLLPELNFPRLTVIVEWIPVINDHSFRCLLFLQPNLVEVHSQLLSIVGVGSYELNIIGRRWWAEHPPYSSSNLIRPVNIALYLFLWWILINSSLLHTVHHQS